MAQLKDTIIHGGLEVVSNSVLGTSGNLVFKDEANGGDYYGHIDIVTPDLNDALNTRAVRISSYSKNTPEGSESETVNTLELGVNDEGIRTVNVSSPEAWRTGIDAAASSHNHSASDITSGTLPINKGGTGATTASGALTNLGAAASSHNHSASNITSGTLALARGGTGATTKTDAFKNLASWTSIGSVKSNESINIKNKLTGYSEIMVIIGYGSTYWSSCVLRASAVTSTLREWYTGGGCDHPFTWNAGAGFYLSTTEFKAMYVYLNSSSAKTATAYLYAR